MPNRQEVLYKDFSARLQPRPLWSASNGTAMRVCDGNGRFMGYQAKPAVRVRKHRPTEAEDNAAGRALRRRTNRKMRNDGKRIPFARR